MNSTAAHTTAAPADKQSAWSVLRHPLFRSLWIANVASGIGSAMHDTTAAWVMTSLTPSKTMVALMQTMASLPLFLLALPAGSLADIVDRRKVVIGAQIGSLIVAATLAAVVLSGKLTPTLLLASTFLLGVGIAFTSPTWQAMLAEIVPKRDLAPALTLGSIAINISRAIGPILAGVLIASLGPASAFLLNAASFVGIIFVLWRWKASTPTVGANRERMIGAMAAALRFTAHSPAIRAVILRTATFVLFGIAPIALLPIVVRVRHFAAADFGALMGAYGAGAIFSAFVLLPRVRERFSADRILFASTCLFGTATLLLSFAHSRLLLGAVLFIAGSAWLTCMSTLTVAAQSAFPNWVRARSSAISLLAMQGAWAAGALLWGTISQHWNTALALRIAGAGTLVSLLLSRNLRVGSAMTADVTPSLHWAPHALAYEPGPEDGPVLITIEYSIDPADTQNFLQAIARLRTIRLRDGAFRWAVFQDLNDPAHFRESFEVGSWSEHLRQHNRATNDDRALEETVRSFHRESTPPAVHHYLMQDIRNIKPLFKPAASREEKS